MHTARRLAATGAALCLLTGCQPATTPTPSPTPSYRCTPEAGGNEYNCTPFQHDDMIAKDKLYAEAEAVYRKFFAEDVRIYRAGGVLEPTTVLQETTTGSFLQDSMDLYIALKKTKTRIVGGEFRLVSLTRVPGISEAGSIVSLRSCVDSSSTRIESPGSKTEKGTAGADVLYFARIDGALKIQQAKGEDVKSC